MGRIAVITHTYDNYRRRKFLLAMLARHWEAWGHEVSVVAGLDNWTDADVAIMHVDLSVVPPAYSEAAKRYPIVVNGAVTDIRKTRLSHHLLTSNDTWPGPVIIKTDLNHCGIPEMTAAQMSRRDGNPAGLPRGPIVSMNRPYPILRSMREVPAEAWTNPGLVVERFLPEQDAHGYYGRVWVFFGDRERCTRYRGSTPIVKSANIVAREPVPVPDEMRAERERLGLDYGKIDFVVREGKAILLDASRTPAAPPPLPGMDASNLSLAGGLEAVMRKYA